MHSFKRDRKFVQHRWMDRGFLQQRELGLFVLHLCANVILQFNTEHLDAKHVSRKQLVFASIYIGAM